MKKNGFTLMETVVALSIAAVALSFFVAAYAPATIGIQRANSVKEAKYLASAVEAELNILRPQFDIGDPDDPSDDPTTSFEKAFQMVSGVVKNASGFPTGGGILIVHKYRANSGAAAVDGISPGFTAEFTSAADSADQPMSIKSFVMNLDTLVNNYPAAAGISPLDSIEGSCFAVSLSQLVIEANTMIVDQNAVVDELKIRQDADDDGLLDSVGFDDYTEALIFVQADFYLLESNAPAYLNAVATGAQELPKKPIYTSRFGIKR